MSLLERLDRWMFPVPTESHAIDRMDLWGQGESIGEPIHAGVTVSQEGALRLSVVWRCVRLISETLAGLPADAVRKKGDIRAPVDRPPPWLEQPNPEATWFEFAERIFESLLMDGNAFVLIGARDAAQLPSQLFTLNPQMIQVKRHPNGQTFFLWDGERELERFGPAAPGGEVLHLKLASAGSGRGLSPIAAAMQAVGLGLAAEKQGARFYGRGQTLSGLMEFESTATQQNIDLTKANWKRRHAGTDRSHEPGILVGAKWKPMSVTPEEAQFLETRAFQIDDIARFYGVPPHLVGLTEKQTSWGTGVEQQGIGFYRFVLRGHIIRFEQAMSQLLPRGQFLRLNPRALLEADSETEAKVLQIELQNAVINRNDWRAFLDMPPVPGGDRFILPAQMQILTTGGVTEPKPEPAPSSNGQVPAEVNP